MENNYTVYMHIFPNNKRYIGITSMGVKNRWRKGKGYYKCQLIYKAIQKYGWENIKHEILFENLTKEEAEQKEIELIAHYKSNQEEYGYNIQNGGNSIGKHSIQTKRKIGSKNKGRVFSEKVREKISISSKKMWENENIRKKIIMSNKNRIPWNKGVPQSENAKEKNRKAHLGKEAWNKGKHTMTEELKEKMRKINKNRTPWNKGKKYSFSEQAKKNMIASNWKSKKVYCFETNKIYISARQCSIELKIDRSGITRACNKNNHKYLQYHFIYIENNSEYLVSNLLFS